MPTGIPPRPPSRPAEPSPAATAVAGRLALQLWLTSMLCWWVIGIQFSRLWWLVNENQSTWIRFCYAWEVPAIGWTGAVLIPWLRLRRLTRRLAEGDVGAGRQLARFPLFAFWMVLGTSTVGYILGALQVDRFANLPDLEAVKIVIQGPTLGLLFAAAAYLLAERAVQDLAVPPRDEVVESLYSKVFSMAVALIVGVAVPIMLHSLTQSQLHREELRAHALSDAVRGATTDAGLQAALTPLGPNTYGFVVRRSNNFVIGGRGTGRVLYGDGRSDFGAIQRREEGWFASRDGEHKVVAFQHRPGMLPDGDGAVFVAVSPIQDYAAELIQEGRTSATVALAALVLGLILAAALARSIALPIGRLRAAATQMARGDMDVPPVGLSRGDEVAALAHAFDRMAVRVRTDEANLRTAYEQLQAAQTLALQHERLSAIGRVASGVAHELNNPLSAVLHLAEDLRADGTRPAHEHEALDTIADQARRCRTIVRDLLSFARGQERRPERATAHEVLARRPRGRRSGAAGDGHAAGDAGRAGHAADLDRRRRAGTGDGQPDRQRSHAAGRRRPGPGGGQPPRGRLALRGRGQRTRNPGGRAAPDLRAVLHHQARGAGHRPGPGGVARDRAAPGRDAQGRSGG